MGGQFAQSTSNIFEGSIGHFRHLLESVLPAGRAFTRGKDSFLSMAMLLPRYSTTISLDNAM